MSMNLTEDRTVGILAYGSLIDEPGEEIDSATLAVNGPVLTPFKVEFARKSTTRASAPSFTKPREIPGRTRSSSNV